MSAGNDKNSLNMALNAGFKSVETTSGSSDLKMKLNCWD